MHTDFIPNMIQLAPGGAGDWGMSGFFVVKGELAAWALGLEESDAPSTEDLVARYGRVELPAPRRRKRRLSHEWYRTLPLRRRELVER